MKIFRNMARRGSKERRVLALTLNDTKVAVNKLHQMVNALAGIIIVIACVVILGIASSKYLLLMSSQVVVVAFVFGNTCKTVFEAITFLFVMHHLMLVIGVKLMEFRAKGTH